MIISLYIHIPFCSSKCDYCDFFSIPSADKALQKNLLDSILKELEIKLTGIEDPHIETIFIGGGTPSVVEPEVFNYFLYSLNSQISDIKKKDCEFSTEANLGSCSKEFMSAAMDGGINRLSLGVQSFNHKTLSKIGRICETRNIFDAAYSVKDYWQEQFSLDIMSGVNEDYLSDIDLALKLKPDHLSVYQLSIEEGTPLYRNIKNNQSLAPEEGLQAESIGVVGRRLESAGYSRYEISNFSKENKTCRHNIRYWDMQSYLGLGPTAVSSLYTSKQRLRTVNTADIKLYINSNFNSGYQEIELLTTEDFLIEHYLMGYRLIRGINEDVFIERFGKNSSEFIPSTISKWSEKGMTARSSSALNESGLLYLDAFLSDVYDEILIDQQI